MCVCVFSVCTVMTHPEDRGGPTAPLTSDAGTAHSQSDWQQPAVSTATRQILLGYMKTT